VKRVFEQVEPFIYDIETGEITDEEEEQYK
jgi:hypothetical protein